MKDKIEYYVYGITYYDTKGEVLYNDYYLNKEERNLIFEQGESQVHPNNFPAEKKAMFHTWRIPEKFEKRKKLYLVEEPTIHIGTTAEDYKIKEIIETETQTNIFDENP